MTKTVKERLINFVLVIVSGVAVSSFTSYKMNQHDESKEVVNDIKQLREQKLDKVEFNNYKGEIDNRIKDSENRIINNQNERFDDLKEMIKLIKK